MWRFPRRYSPAAASKSRTTSCFIENSGISNRLKKADKNFRNSSDIGGLTSNPGRIRIQTVRRLTACSAIPALLLAVFYAPLFHVHTHPGEAATIHAHLPEFEPEEDESVVHMERLHSHADARSIDILTTTAPQAVHFDTTLVSAYTIT